MSIDIFEIAEVDSAVRKQIEIWQSLPTTREVISAIEGRVGRLIKGSPPTASEGNQINGTNYSVAYGMLRALSIMESNLSEETEKITEIEADYSDKEL